MLSSKRSSFIKRSPPTNKSPAVVTIPTNVDNPDTFRLEAFTEPTAIFGIPDKLKAVLAVPVTSPVKLPVTSPVKGPTNLDAVIYHLQLH